MLQSNKLMNKIDKIDEASVLIVKEQKRRSHVKNPRKKKSKLLVETMIATTANRQGT